VNHKRIDHQDWSGTVESAHSSANEVFCLVHLDQSGAAAVEAAKAKAGIAVKDYVTKGFWIVNVERKDGGRDSKGRHEFSGAR